MRQHEQTQFLAAIQSTVQAAIVPIQALITTLSGKVDVLSSDHIKRADIDQLRVEMHAGFNAMESKFVPRELGEQRYRDISADVNANTQALEAMRRDYERQLNDLSTRMEAKAEKQQERGFVLSGQAVTWLLMTLVGVIAVIALFHKP